LGIAFFDAEQLHLLFSYLLFLFVIMNMGNAQNPILTERLRQQKDLDNTAANDKPVAHAQDESEARQMSSTQAAEA
jgi:hypothetical protein